MTFLPTATTDISATPTVPGRKHGRRCQLECKSHEIARWLKGHAFSPLACPAQVMCGSWGRGVVGRDNEKQELNLGVDENFEGVFPKGSC